MGREREPALLITRLSKKKIKMKSMSKGFKCFLGGVLASLVFFVVSSASAQQAEVPKVANKPSQPVASEHPLMPVIRWAERERPRVVAEINDYTAIMTKQENINGEIQEAQVMELKFRQEPFSVYLKFRYPKKINGQEAIYVRGQNDNKLIAHGVGVERAFGTQRLDPEGFIAMRGNKYPITDVGVLNLVDKLLEVGRRDVKYGECDVNYYDKGIMVDDRECTLIEVVHPVPRKNFQFHVARIYVDKELNLPIRYESYDWPKKEGETPMLIEAYTYQKLRINVGLTDKDFDPKNPAYNYP